MPPGTVVAVTFVPILFRPAHLRSLNLQPFSFSSKNLCHLASKRCKKGAHFVLGKLGIKKTRSAMKSILFQMSVGVLTAISVGLGGSAIADQRRPPPRTTPPVRTAPPQPKITPP